MTIIQLPGKDRAIRMASGKERDITFGVDSTMYVCLPLEVPVGAGETDKDMLTDLIRGVDRSLATFAAYRAEIVTYLEEHRGDPQPSAPEVSRDA